MTLHAMTSLSPLLTRCAALTLAGGVVWLALTRLVPIRSERFYALIPLLWLLDLIVFVKPRSGAVGTGLVPAAVLMVLCVWAALWVVARLTGGRAQLTEALLVLYFLCSVVILFFVISAAVDKLLNLLPMLKAAQGSPALWRKALHHLVMLVLILPYGITQIYLHRPRISNRVTPQAALGLTYEEVRLTARDGVSLSAWFIPYEGSATAVILCHGWGANKSNLLSLVPMVRRAACHVLLLDFRAHGESGGHTFGFGYYEGWDVQAAAQYLAGRRDVDPRKIVACGYSLGGVALLQAAPYTPEICGFIVDSGYADLDTEARRDLSKMLGGLHRVVLPLCKIVVRLELGVSPDEIAPRTHAAAVSPRPLLIVHGARDPFTPPDEARKVYEAADEPKELWVVEGAGHIEAAQRAPEEYERRVKKFLHQCVDNESK